jgi:hypothetical protein
VEPAPTLIMRKTMYARIYRWVRAGLQDCQLLANIVGGTRPYKPLTDIIVFDANAITNY